MKEFFEQRRSNRNAVISAFGQGGGRVKQTPNLTAKIMLNKLCADERRQPTPEEIELCSDFVLVPRNPGAPQ